MKQEIAPSGVAESLRVELFRAGISQQKAAAMVGYSSSYVSRRISGDTPLTLDDVERLASAAGLKVTVTLAPIEDEVAA